MLWRRYGGVCGDTYAGDMELFMDVLMEALWMCLWRRHTGAMEALMEDGGAMEALMEDEKWIFGIKFLMIILKYFKIYCK